MGLEQECANFFRKFWKQQLFPVPAKIVQTLKRRFSPGGNLKKSILPLSNPLRWQHTRLISRSFFPTLLRNPVPDNFYPLLIIFISSWQFMVYGHPPRINSRGILQGNRVYIPDSRRLNPPFSGCQATKGVGQYGPSPLPGKQANPQKAGRRGSFNKAFRSCSENFAIL